MAATAPTPVRYISGSQLSKIRQQQRKSQLPQSPAPAAAPAAAPDPIPAVFSPPQPVRSSLPQLLPTRPSSVSAAQEEQRQRQQRAPVTQNVHRQKQQQEQQRVSVSQEAQRQKQQQEYRDQEIQRRKLRQQQQQQGMQRMAAVPAAATAPPQIPLPPPDILQLIPAVPDTAAAAAAVTKPAPPRHKSFALVIGIEYTAYAEDNPDDRLPGCHADVANMISVLRDRYGVSAADMVVLADDGVHKEPSRSAIVRGFSKLLTDVAKTAAQFPTTTITIWLTYSGHGSRVADRGGSSSRDELDGADETIVPSDYRKAGLITDDELRTMIDRGYPRRKPEATAPVSLYAIFDSCHSGSVMDLPWGWDSAEPGAVPKTYSRRKVDPVYSMLAGSVVSLSACMDTQTAVSEYDPEANARFPWQGALTRAFCALPATVSNAHDVLGSIQTALADRGLSQKTTICVSRLPPNRTLSAIPWPSRQDDNAKP